MNNTSKFTAASIAKLAMMTAVSVVLQLIVRIPFPPAPFLVYDPADVPIYITAFAFGWRVKPKCVSRWIVVFTLNASFSKTFFFF